MKGHDEYRNMSSEITMFKLLGMVLTVFITVSSLLVYWDNKDECEEGMLREITYEHNSKCVKGEWQLEEKSDVDKARTLKAYKVAKEKEVKEREAFCGKDNVTINYALDEKTIFDVECTDYSLVPDENLK